MDEISLTGGRITSGVVRIGTTVRRPTGDHSSFVHVLLRHLESVGFDCAPRYLGIDDESREILSFLEGDVPCDLGWWSDDQIAAATRLIRQFHDATTGSDVAGIAEVVCHNDLSPCNFVFVDGMPCGIIDFDAARPGTRLWDLGYAAWLWFDIGNDEHDAEMQMGRLRLFAEAYGISDVTDLVRAMLARQRVMADGKRERVEVAKWAARCLAWTERHCT